MDQQLSDIVTKAAIEVQKQLGGPGLLEGIYEAALCHELSLHGIECQRQVPIPVTYKAVTVREPVFLDILVNQFLIIEVKATPKDLPYYQVQLNTHLRLTGLKWGMLINFGKKDVAYGISHVCHT